MDNRSKKKIFWVILFIVAVLLVTITLVQKKPSNFEIRLGSIQVLTGDAKSYGEQLRDGVNLAVKEINGTSSESKVEVVIYDSENNKDLALEKLKALKERDKINFVADVMSSGIALNAMPYITKNKMLFISAVNTSPELTNISPYFYRIIPSDGASSEQLAKWAIEMGYKTAALLHATDVWGTGLKNVLGNKYKELGGSIVYVKDADPKQTIFKPVVSELIEKRPDVVFLVMYPREAALLLKEARKQGFTSHFMGTDNFTGSELIQVGGDAVDGVMFVTPGQESRKSERYKHFLSLYQTTFKTDKNPPLFTMMGYDMIHLIATVAKDAEADVEKARDILAKINFDGVSGKIAFDKNHDVIVKDYSRKILVFDKQKKSYEAVDFRK